MAKLDESTHFLPGFGGESVDNERRALLLAAGAGALAAALGGCVEAGTVKTLRWGVVGTGGIANSMAPRILEAEHAELAAVSSRRMGRRRSSPTSTAPAAPSTRGRR
jgi:hypothetical protein